MQTRTMVTSYMCIVTWLCISHCVKIIDIIDIIDIIHLYKLHCTLSGLYRRGILVIDTDYDHVLMLLS